MSSRLLFSAAAVALLGLGGCAVVPGPYGPTVVPAPVVIGPVYRHRGYAPPPVVHPGYGYGRGYGGHGGYGYGGYGRGYYR